MELIEKEMKEQYPLISVEDAKKEFAKAIQDRKEYIYDMYK